jgi:GT2 family glycosyltransferase
MVKKPAGISVVIPTYKKSGQVSRCLERIFLSDGLGTLFTLQIVVVDDSPDGDVKKMVERLRTKKPPGVSFIYKKPGRDAGIAAARNVGVSLASNGLVIAIDSDILAERDAILQTLLAFERSPKAAMVIGNVFWTGGPLDGRLDRPRRHDRRMRIGKTTYAEMMHGRYVAFLKEAFSKVGGYDADLFPMQGEGPDLSIRFWRAGYPLVHDSKIRVRHLSGYAKGEKTGSRYLYHGWDIRRTALMFRSMLLYFYKYGSLDAGRSNWMRTIAMESKSNFGDKTGYMILSTLAGALKWISTNFDRIEKSKRKVPEKYDFKPYDVFTDMKMFKKCIREFRL